MATATSQNIDNGVSNTVTGILNRFANTSAITSSISNNVSSFEGTDTVQTNIAWTLASNFENLTLTGTVDINGTGNSVANVITGNSGINTLDGAAGNDTIIGGAGNDILYGGADADTFLFDLTSIGSIDTIKDYSSAASDKLDISDILIGWDVLDNITDFIQLTDSGSNTVMKVDRDGTGATYSFTQVATLEAVTGLTDEATLLAAGKIIAA